MFVKKKNVHVSSIPLHVHPLLIATIGKLSLIARVSENAQRETPSSFLREPALIEADT